MASRTSNQALSKGLDAGTYCTYELLVESTERFAIKKYLLIIGKKKNM